jgi:formylglycine-generating enzyme required for sulfatase activity
MARIVCRSFLWVVCALLSASPLVAGDSTNTVAVSTSQPTNSMTIDLRGVKMEFAWIPAGVFMMGSPATELDRQDNETQHKVTISKGFWMGKYEVTQEQWENVMGKNPGSYVGKTRPVERVSWADCQEFIAKLNASPAKPKALVFRMPTEAEWEYACRAGTTTRFYFGDSADDLHNYGNYCDISSAVDMGQRDRRYDDGHSTTAPVGSYRPNKFGLYDMHGNVWEWCEDWFAPYPAGPVTDPVQTQPVVGTRVFRGGGWSNAAGMCRSARRGQINPDMRSEDTGLRLVMAVR